SARTECKKAAAHIWKSRRHIGKCAPHIWKSSAHFVLFGGLSGNERVISRYDRQLSRYERQLRRNPALISRYAALQNADLPTKSQKDQFSTSFHRFRGDMSIEGLACMTKSLH